MLARRLQRPGIFYGWVIVLVSFLIIAFVFGVRLSFGIFFDALTRESDFGWSRADTAGVFSVTMLVFAATSTSIGGKPRKSTKCSRSRALVPIGLVMKAP